MAQPWKDSRVRFSFLWMIILVSLQYLLYLQLYKQNYSGTTSAALWKQFVQFYPCKADPTILTESSSFSPGAKLHKHINVRFRSMFPVRSAFFFLLNNYMVHSTFLVRRGTGKEREIPPSPIHSNHPHHPIERAIYSNNFTLGGNGCLSKAILGKEQRRERSQLPLLTPFLTAILQNCYFFKGIFKHKSATKVLFFLTWWHCLALSFSFKRLHLLVWTDN